VSDLLILFLGVTAFRMMPADIFRKSISRSSPSSANTPGLSTPEMEPRVTTYSEYAMSTNAHGIKDLDAQTWMASREHTEYIAATISGAGRLILPNASHFALL
jgi:hypothetical protein